MDQRIGVRTAAHVGQKIGHGNGCCCVVQVDIDHTLRRLQANGGGRDTVGNYAKADCEQRARRSNHRAQDGGVADVDGARHAKAPRVQWQAIV